MAEKKRVRRKVLDGVLTVGIALPALVGGWLVYDGFQDEKPTHSADTLSSSVYMSSPKPSAEPTVEETTEPTPQPTAETKPTVEETTEPVKKVEPSILEIDSVNIEAPIVEGGNVDGYMELPRSDKVAEYTGSAPLESPTGSTVIAGHVNYADGSWGAMGDLHKVSKGDLIEVSDENGVPYEFKVTEHKVIDKQELPKDIFRVQGKKQLVVVTCHVDVIDGVQVYHSNTVVTAKPVK